MDIQVNVLRHPVILAVVGSYTLKDTLRNICFTPDRSILFDFSADLNDVRFSAYRTAMKLRTVQKKLCCEYEILKKSKDNYS